MSKEIVCAWCHRNAYFGDLIAYGNGPYFHEACRSDHHLIIGGQEQTTTLPETLPAAPACDTCGGTGKATRLCVFSAGGHMELSDEQYPCPDCNAGEGEKL